MSHFALINPVLILDGPESSVSFPSCDTPPSPLPPPQPQGLRPPSFRRISLPASSVRPPPPLNINNRSSVVSIASIESLAEEGPSQALSILTHAESQNPPGMSPPKARFLKDRPSSVGNFGRIRRNSRRPNSLRPINEVLTAKRNKVLLEILETEKVYVDALDLIYTVGNPSILELLRLITLRQRSISSHP
jgi:hypothetical protein